MEACHTQGAVVNLRNAPDVPVMRWPLKQRLRMSMERCQGKVRTKGRGRRHRREVQTKQSIEWLQTLRGGHNVVMGARRLTRTWRDLVEMPLPMCPGWVYAMRARARTLLDLAVKHGPASGWGLPQPEPEGRAPQSWTPYYVPKASEKCWRWWRHVCLALARLLLRLALGLLSLVPLHRARLEQEEAEERSRRTHEVDPSTKPGCRDKSPEPLEVLLTRCRSKFGM